MKYPFLSRNPLPRPPSHKICSSLCQLSNPSFLQPAQFTHHYFSICKGTVSLIPQWPTALGLFSDTFRFDALKSSCGPWLSPISCGLTIYRSYASYQATVFQFSRLLTASACGQCLSSCRVTPSLTGSNSDLFWFSANFTNSGVSYNKRAKWGGGPPLPYSPWMLHNPQLRNTALDKTAHAFGVLFMILTWLFKYLVW